MDSVTGRKGQDDPRFEVVTQGAHQVLSSLPFESPTALNILVLAIAMQIKLMAESEAQERYLHTIVCEGIDKSLRHCLLVAPAH